MGPPDTEAAAIQKSAEGKQIPSTRHLPFLTPILTSTEARSRRNACSSWSTLQPCGLTRYTRTRWSSFCPCAIWPM